jgi:tetratricopeptide (TPR) repeat protein
VATIAVTVVAYRLRRSYPLIMVAWSIYLVILLPNLGLISINRQLAADRYSYVAMIGFVVVFAGKLNAQWPVSRIGRSVGCAVTTALIVALIVLTRAQCRTWRSSEALWTHALSHGGETVQEVQNAVGLALLELGRLEEARHHFQEAIRLEPRYGIAHNSLGTLLARQGQFSAAKAEFAESSRLTPQDPTAHNNLGNILLSEGQVEPAVREYATAVSLDPDGGVAHLDDLLVFRRSTLRAQLVPLIRAVVASPRDQTALRELERALTSPDK